MKVVSLLVYWSKVLINLFNKDCLDVLKTLDDNSIDLVVTDCPYKIVSGGGSTKTVNPTSGIFAKKEARAGKVFEYNEIQFKEWLPDVFRVLKDQSHCYIMINSRNLCNLQNECEKVGFKFQNLLIWDKGNVTPNKYYMQGAEFILMLRKGGAKGINNLGASNIFRIDNVRNKTHPTEKPLKLMRALVENSSKENEIVLDPFMGTGSVGMACIASNRKFIGIEIDPKYFNVAKQRMGIDQE